MKLVNAGPLIPIAELSARGRRMPAYPLAATALPVRLTPIASAMTESRSPSASSRPYDLNYRSAHSCRRMVSKPISACPGAAIDKHAGVVACRGLTVGRHSRKIPESTLDCRRWRQRSTTHCLHLLSGTGSNREALDIDGEEPAPRCSVQMHFWRLHRKSCTPTVAVSPLLESGSWHNGSASSLVACSARTAVHGAVDCRQSGMWESM